MEVLLNFMVNGIDTKESFDFEIEEDFSKGLVEYIGKSFSDSELTINQCSMNKDNYFLCINDDEYREVFGFEISGNKIFFLEGIYSPQDLVECLDILHLYSSIIEFCSEYQLKAVEEDDKSPNDDDDSDDFEWL